MNINWNEYSFNFWIPLRVGGVTYIDKAEPAWAMEFILGLMWAILSGPKPQCLTGSKSTAVCVPRDVEVSANHISIDVPDSLHVTVTYAYLDANDYTFYGRRHNIWNITRRVTVILPRHVVHPQTSPTKNTFLCQSLTFRKREWLSIPF